ncbi:nuclear RNA export factor 1 [Pieris rapae]|uniref:nuclear RNA export factor 1 n=1 Tax=Pieris rapae TaxID=64459 RepID=UPI001E27DABA|nr:nuclear RNA export factor 1 [Pieris rapae]
MPKRGGGRPRNNWKNGAPNCFEHDDRIHHTGRRVMFKQNQNKGKNNKFKNWNDAKILFDDDVDMGASGIAQNRRGAYRGRGGRLGSPPPRPSHHKKKFITGVLPWYQITIPYGAKHEKDVILKALLSHISPEVFIPHYFKIEGNSAIFYVDDVKVAEKLFHADRKITMPNGFKLVVIVRNAVPRINITDDMKEKMKLAMAKRYNPTTKALDLTKFHADPDLVDVFCALFRPIIMLAAVDIIAENIPDLEALNLNDNKLHGLEHLKILATKFKNLKILYMGDNRIPSVAPLEALKALPLVELYLKGNPLVNRFNDNETYKSEVRRKFPKLTRLDGDELPPPIGFDIPDDVSLPPAQQSFLVDPNGQELIKEFLKQYFAIYDSESRQPLLDAYHESATCSLAASYLTTDSRSSNSTNKLNTYMVNSRNLMRITDRDHRRRYLKTGKLQVVSLLSELPKTSHDLMGFAVDLVIFNPNMVVLTMNGVFREIMTTGTPLRSFHRTFVIVPNNSGGFCILNDMYFITNTTKEQEDKAFSTSTPASVPAPTPTPAVSAVPAIPAVTPAAQPVAGTSQEETQKMMLNMLSQQTGMNEHWSINCLQETGWDYQRALFIFNQLQSEGKIPQEAFVK